MSTITSFVISSYTEPCSEKKSPNDTTTSIVRATTPRTTNITVTGICRAGTRHRAADIIIVVIVVVAKEEEDPAEPMTVGAEMKPSMEAVLDLRTIGEAAAVRTTTTVSSVKTFLEKDFAQGCAE